MEEQLYISAPWNLLLSFNKHSVLGQAKENAPEMHPWTKI